MTTLPPYLHPGDNIAIVCPAGYMPREKAQTCIDTLQHWGYRVKIGRTLGDPSDNYFSGSDDDRLKDFQQMLDDPTVQAILCGRGGYGLSRIIDRIDFSRFRLAPKWIIGYSDITLLHAHIETNFNIATLHAPMAAAFNEGGAEGPYVQSLRQALAGNRAAYSCAPHPFNRTGQATAPLTGGNLALLSHLAGTSSATQTAGKILFLEDVGEYLYNIDRMLWQLKRSGRLDRLAGLVIGGFTELKDTTRPFGAAVEDIVRDCIKEYEYPVCFGFPVGHGGDNLALKTGVTYALTVAGDRVSLTETSTG
jgi:muramoyltetrapeptide carboxypeptidase